MQRYWEVDSARGIAILMMLVSNFVTDLVYFKIYPTSAFWSTLALITAVLFVFIAGLSLNLSYSQTKKHVYMKFIKRGTFLFALGMGITLATYLFMKICFIYFGVLHLIGLSTILAIPFLKFRNWHVALASAIVLIGVYLENFIFSFSGLLWAGFMPQGFCSVDYFPILPWFGVFLLGLCAGQKLYPEGRHLLKDNKTKTVKFMTFLGRNTLAIYLIHQLIFVPFILIFLL